MSKFQRLILGMWLGHFSSLIYFKQLFIIIKKEFPVFICSPILSALYSPFLIIYCPLFFIRAKDPHKVGFLKKTFLKKLFLSIKKYSSLLLGLLFSFIPGSNREIKSTCFLLNLFSCFKCFLAYYHSTRQ